MKNICGVPLCRSIPEVYAALEEQGVRRDYWMRLETVGFEEYRGRPLDDEDARNLRFAPAIEAVILEGKQRERFVGFRSRSRDWATTIATLANPDDPADFLLPIVGEWKHGVEDILLCFASGTLGKSDQSPEDCARREFEEETGFRLARIRALSKGGIPPIGRHSTCRYYPFLGEIAELIARGPARLDRGERLGQALVPLSLWLEICRAGDIVEDSSISTTLLALDRLGRIKW